MRIKELLEGDDWENNEVPSLGPDATKFYSNKVQSIRQQLQILRAQRAVYLNKDTKVSGGSTKYKSQISRLGKKIDHLEATLKHDFKIPVGNNKVQNPLATCEYDFYVGIPGACPLLTSTQQTLFLQIKNALAEAGLGPLTIMYAGRKSKIYPGINFVAVGADGKFVWQKYDPSAGAGQNDVYISGVGKMHTSDFVKNPKKFLKQIV